MNENFERTCSSAVLIQTITREPTRNTAIVLAEDINTGYFLRCDVIVDAIFSLNLTTTTRELYIEDIPEAFEVRAYDEQGIQLNIFTHRFFSLVKVYSYTLRINFNKYINNYTGNQFTTLAGIEFLWEIGDADKRIPSNTKPTSKVLRFMTYEESQYERPVSVAALDSIGKRGHIVLIEGIRTGTAKVNLYTDKSKCNIV